MSRVHMLRVCLLLASLSVGWAACTLGEEATVVLTVGIADALIAKGNADTAVAAAKASGLGGAHNGPRDAFRHCLWSCLMTRIIGKSKAKKVGDIHEDCNPNPKLERRMDLCNNHEGRNLGMKKGGNCQADCLAAVRAGKLITSLAEAGAKGDPHILKWDGNFFDYHGECDLVLLNAPDFGAGAGLLVQIRIKRRYDYSFIESAAVRIGNDTLEVSSYGDYTFNGVATAQVPQPMAGFPLTHTAPSEKEKVFTIDAGHGIAVVVSTFRDIVAVSLEYSSSRVTSEWLGSSTGLMGSFDGLMLARDGLTVMEDPNNFGQEWQVHPGQEPTLFQDKDRYPQHPAKCVLPQVTTTDGRRLGASVSREDANRACLHVAGQQAKEACIYDVIGMNDIELAKTY